MTEETIVMEFMSLQEKDGTKIHDAWWFYCPGCECYHNYILEYFNGRVGPKWSYDEHSKSFIPSLKATRQEPGKKHVCHIWSLNGSVQYLSDCTHHLANKSVPFVLKPKD